MALEIFRTYYSNNSAEVYFQPGEIYVRISNKVLSWPSKGTNLWTLNSIVFLCGTLVFAIQNSTSIVLVLGHKGLNQFNLVSIIS